MNELLQAVMGREQMSKADALAYIREVYSETGKDMETTLEELGFEPDYVYDLYSLVA